MAYGITDEYDKASRFLANNTVSQLPTEPQGYSWFSTETINATKQCKAILATNTDIRGVTFTSYSYGSELMGVTNHILFSENIRTGLTSGSSAWAVYGGASITSVNGSVYSTIVMPDGSTNGTILQTGNAQPNSGIYFPFPANTFLQRGKIYTVSVWVACDDRQSYPSTGKFRFSFYGDTTTFPTSYSRDFDISTTPVRVSHTFVANNLTSSTFENVAFGNGSGSPPAIRLVLWGAQLIEGNTAGTYIPTSTQYNRLSGGIGSALPVYAPTRGVYEIQSVPHTVAPQTTVLLNTGAFTVSTLNPQNLPPPPNLQIYGMY